MLKPVPLAPSSTAGYNSPVPPVSQTIRVTVLFFGRLKDVAGHAEESAEIGDAATIEQLFGLYAARYPELARYRSSVVASRNQEFAAWDTPLRSGDEVAFLPPVSGGGRIDMATLPHHYIFQLVREPIDIAALARSVCD